MPFNSYGPIRSNCVDSLSRKQTNCNHIWFEVECIKWLHTCHIVFFHITSIYDMLACPAICIFLSTSLNSHHIWKLTIVTDLVFLSISFLWTKIDFETLSLMKILEITIIIDRKTFPCKLTWWHTFTTVNFCNGDILPLLCFQVIASNL